MVLAKLLKTPPSRRTPIPEAQGRSRRGPKAIEVRVTEIRAISVGATTDAMRTPAERISRGTADAVGAVAVGEAAASLVRMSPRAISRSEKGSSTSSPRATASSA